MVKCLKFKSHRKKICYVKQISFFMALEMQVIKKGEIKYRLAWMNVSCVSHVTDTKGNF